MSPCGAKHQYMIPKSIPPDLPPLVAQAVAMSDVTWPQAVFAAVTVAGGAWGLYMQARMQAVQAATQIRLGELASQQEMNHKLMNSRMDQLLEAKGVASHAEGRIEGAKEEQARVAEGKLAAATAKSVIDTASSSVIATDMATLKEQNLRSIEDRQEIHAAIKAITPGPDQRLEEIRGQS